MNTVRFLFDENVAGAMLDCITRDEPGMDIVCVGQENGPPNGTKDDDLIRFAEATGRVIVTFDKKTMPDYALAHQNSGNHTYGVFVLRQRRSLRSLANSLVFIWSASEADEWIDRLELLPW